MPENLGMLFCLIVLGHNVPTDTNDYDALDRYRHARPIDAAVGYTDQSKGLQYILVMIK